MGRGSCGSGQTHHRHGRCPVPGSSTCSSHGWTLGRWGLFEVALASRARTTGTQIVKVPAAFTSQRCSRCGNTDRNNRESQAMFRCGSCGYQANADVNAAINVRDATEAVPPLTGRAVRDRSRNASCRPPTQRRRQPTPETGISCP
ncbi:zinc ribbon domain-containing protein [Micromonospora sp. NPDC050200]|uniref:zinc ribbon domain-containing protein n=1 Tax=Micromonospora sp. NPDC050200 TaxID=3155664 RepID=UPI0033FCF7D8